MPSENPVLPNKAHDQDNRFVDQDNRFVESDKDVVGLLAFSYFMISSGNESIKQILPHAIAHASDRDIAIFRSAAQRSIDEMFGRRLEAEVELIKTDIFQSTYKDIMKSNYDRLLSDQEAGFERIQRSVDEARQSVEETGTKTIASVERVHSISRQVIIAVIASFVFGLILTLAAYVENPLKSMTGHRVEQDRQAQPSK